MLFFDTQKDECLLKCLSLSSPARCLETRTDTKYCKTKQGTYTTPYQTMEATVNKISTTTKPPP